MSEGTKTGIKRRDFLKVIGAGSAGAATAGCSTSDVERLIPYVVPAEEIVPGVPTWYASTCRECPAGCGIHVETHSGRVTKVEGNPDSPISHGNLCARGQASVQGLYHPDRYQGPQISESGVRTLDVSWSVAESQMAEKIRELQQAGHGGEIVFLTPAYTGTMERLANDWVSAVGARRVIYEAFPQQPRALNFADADLLISFGADFLETWGSPVDYAWQFAQMRDHRIGKRGKFVWIGAHRPLTGINADQWIAPKPGTEAILAQAISGSADTTTAARDSGVSQEIIEALRQEYQSATRPVVLGPGAGYTTRDSRSLKGAIDSMNARAGIAPEPAATGSREIMRLVQDMGAGRVSMIIIDGDINPAYSLPGAIKFAEAMERVPTRVSFSTFPDETAALATHVLPSHHFLEDWDDYSPAPGVQLLVQPTMRPVFNTKSKGDVLLNVAATLGLPVSPAITANSYYDYLRANWGTLAPGQAWRDIVKAGGYWAVADAQAGLPASPGLEGAPVVPLTATPAEPTSFAAVEFEGADDAEFNLVVYPSYRFYDGRTANRPWLLELPDPVTKVAWQSSVEIHPRTAREMGIEQGDVVRVTSPYGSVDTFAYVYPGVRPDTVAIQMGLGHEAFGRFTEGHGVNPNRLLGTDVDASSGDLARYGVRVSISKIDAADAEGELTQGLFEAGVRSQNDREIAQAISLAEVATLSTLPNPVVPGEHEEIEELRGMGGFAPIPSETDPASYPPPGTHYGEYVEGATRWAMAIDISRCIGCSACVTACYAENNIPVVGPSEVRRGRELSWLRIERYFKVGQDEEAAYEDDGTDDVRFLPMLCQHCGNAPCEPVCPVYAAYHTPDGLNGQVYNRCVGTRYCANNCPYKVRYFNWFTYDFIEPLNLQLNPDVAVREKGVMEKCTFCVQRIREGERNSQLENRPVRDGDIVPACVQTCPTEVFVFGNIADPESQVAQAARSGRGYRALEVLNTQPAIVYLKKVTLGEPEHGGHHAAEPAAATATHESIG